MTLPQNDLLVEHLVELSEKLKPHQIPVIVGGGMSSYLRCVFLYKNAISRYGFSIDTRSTDDLDVFLTTEVIAIWLKS